MRRTLKTMTALGLAAAMVLGSAGVAEARKHDGRPGKKECHHCGMGASGSSITMGKPVVSGGAIHMERPVASGTAIGIKKPGKTKKFKVTAVCKASGKITVKFSQKVEWSDEATAALTDAEGNAIEVTLSKKNKKSAIVEGEGMVIGNTYTLVLTGVKKADEEEFGSITVKVKAKKLKSKCRAKKIGKKIKAKKKNVIRIKFKGNVQTKDTEATVTDEEGKEYTAKIKGKSKGSVKIAVKGLEKNTEYTVTITGVKTKKEKNYASVTTTFKTKKK